MFGGHDFFKRRGVNFFDEPFLLPGKDLVGKAVFVFSDFHIFKVLCAAHPPWFESKEVLTHRGG